MRRPCPGPDGQFDAQFMEDYEALFVDTSDDVRSRWDFDVDQLSVRGAFYRNTGDTAQYEATRETRIVTPDNFTLEAAANLGLVYDSASIGWALRVETQYRRLDLGGDTRPQESADDLVASSELRLNAAEINLGSRELPLIPFVRTEFDTEYTATENPNEDEPDFPHQKVLRERIGLMLLAGRYVPEVRFGVLGQHDFSEGVVHDAGVFAGLKLRLPMGPLVLQSDNRFRYHFSDGDDRAIDLGMVFTSDTRLLIPVVDGISFLRLPMSSWSAES